MVNTSDPDCCYFYDKFSTLFASATLPVYALQFNLIVLLFIYVLKFRVKPSKKLAEVLIQQNSPEKNLYSFENDTERFRHDLVSIKLPFYGMWTVAQGYDDIHPIRAYGNMLSISLLQIRMESNIKAVVTFLKIISALTNLFFHLLPGILSQVVDDIEDNIIGIPNIKENWGNTVIIRHNNFLFSSLSHLNKNSVAVKPGDKVSQGDLLGKCGNSGRSPYPHLHFQLQQMPYIGSQTLHYPVSYFIEHKESGFELRNFSVPSQ